MDVVEDIYIIHLKIFNMESKSYVNHWDNSISLRKSKFIKKAMSVHNNKYDYSKVNYVNTHTKVCIICPEHGEFWQDPASHVKGSGCPLCGNERVWESRGRYTSDYIISLFKQVHGDKYDYSKVNYINSSTKVCIICPEHGDFWMLPSQHIRGVNCPKCMGNKKLTKEDFITKAKEIHGDKYDYSKVEYINSEKKVCIICPEHGEFWQNPSHHLEGHGCMKCSLKHKPQCKPLTSEEFIKNAKEIHGDKYDYSKVEYINNYTKVCIICPEHGEFWQKPSNHIFGKGCPKCNNSKLEIEVENVLCQNNISYISQKTFKWLKYNSSMRLDFFLPEYNIAIECQGLQHFKQVWFNKNEKNQKYYLLENIQLRDSRKRNRCEEHGIKILYYTNVILDEYPYEVITDLDELMKKIMG